MSAGGDAGQWGMDNECAAAPLQDDVPPADFRLANDCPTGQNSRAGRGFSPTRGGGRSRGGVRRGGRRIVGWRCLLAAGGLRGRGGCGRCRCRVSCRPTRWRCPGCGWWFLRGCRGRGCRWQARWIWLCGSGAGRRRGSGRRRYRPQRGQSRG